METDMRVPRLALAAVAAAGALALSGCADDLYGPYGYGYGGYGYGSPYSGYGYGYPYASYGYGNAYGGYGYYGGYDPFGWYSDSYYPGVGIYVYDSGRNRHVWNGDQQRYWSTRRTNWQNRSGTTYTRENWSGFNRGAQGTTTSGWHHHRG
jgi:hypothetical protein